MNLLEKLNERYPLFMDYLNKSTKNKDYTFKGEVILVVEQYNATTDSTQVMPFDKILKLVDVAPYMNIANLYIEGAVTVLDCGELAHSLKLSSDYFQIDSKLILEEIVDRTL